jgi:chemotaxis protein MotA
MLILGGLLIVLGSVIAGYLLEKGNIFVLLQPAELLIIGGGALGIILVGNPWRNLRALMRAVVSIRRNRAHTADTYLDILTMLYVLFQYSRRAGMPGLEPHVEAPHKSEVFEPYDTVLADRVVLDFICDSFRIAIAAGIESHEMERLMSLDMDVQRAGRQHPVRSLVTVADSLPGLGIVAAVLGVVVTMKAIGGSAADIGQQVAAALVGTFLGILLCYGVVGPLAGYLECMNRSRAEYLQVIRVAISSFFHGASPMVSAESARRSIPLDVRPSYDDMEQVLRKAKIPAVHSQERSSRMAAVED